MIISRRSILRTAAAGVVTAATANAQTSDIPQPERPGTDIGPRDVIRDRENPDVLVPLATDSGTLPNLKSPSRMLSEYSL
jgi:oxalate decarboxylase